MAFEVADVFLLRAPLLSLAASRSAAAALLEGPEALAGSPHGGAIREAIATASPRLSRAMDGACPLATPNADVRASLAT